MNCKCCGQEIKPSLSIEEYERRAVPRLAAIDRLWDRIQREDLNPSDPVYERYERLMKEQGDDEVAAGL